MKKLLAVLSLSLLAVSTTFAQEAPKQDRKLRTERAGKDGVTKESKTPEEKATKKTEMLANKYNLTPAQKSKLQALHLRQANETAALKTQPSDTEANKAQLREANKAKKAQWNAELKSILTEEQFAQYQADRKAKAGNLEGKAAKKGQHPKGKEHRKMQKS